MSNSKKIAVVLSGCGVFDGAEIHEAVLSLLAIVKNGAVYEIFAPDIHQHHVINHITGTEMEESRNVLVESARIARGKIKPLSDFDGEQFDGILFPGGFGAAKNLSTVAFDGSNCSVDKDVSNVIKKMYELKKPIGALCISPAVIAKVLGNSDSDISKVEVTIGQDEGTINAIEQMGANHKNTNNGEIIIDENFKVVTSPCYMLDANIIDIEQGADKTVKAMIALM